MIFSGTAHGAVDIESTAHSSCRRRFVRVPTPLLQDAGWNGASSLAGGYSHSAVLFDEQPEMKHVRAKALRSLAAKAQAVVEGDVGYVVYNSVVLVRRDRPQHVDEQLQSREGCLWGSILYSIHSSSCFLGQFVVWFCLRPVRGIVYSGAGSSNSGMCLVCRDTSDLQTIFIFVQYAYREYQIHLFSSPVVAVFCCETNCKQLFCSF